MMNRTIAIKFVSSVVDHRDVAWSGYRISLSLCLIKVCWASLDYSFGCCYSYVVVAILY